MKTVFVLWVSLAGAQYEYSAALEFYGLTRCTEAARMVEATHHAYCQRGYIITQPDGSVRPRARPTE